MKLTITLDLANLNDLQVASMVRLADSYPHGWSTADLAVRRDAVERVYEADWALEVARAVKRALAT